MRIGSATFPTFRQPWRLVSIADHPSGQVDRRARTLAQSRAELLRLTVELHISLAAGLPLFETLRDLERRSSSTHQRRLLRSLADHVSGGYSFSDALGRHPRAFPSLYVELVASAEETGRLQETLQDLEAFLNKEEKVRSQLADTSRYPAIFFTVTLVSFLLLARFVLPMFIRTLPDSWESQLPLATQLLFAFSRLLTAHGGWFVVMGALGIVASRRLLRIPAVRQAADRARLRLPILGALEHELFLMQVSHTLASMLQAGVDIRRALARCARLTTNAELQRRFHEVEIGIQNGQPLSRLFQKHRVGSSLVVRLIALGESTGHLPPMLRQVGWYYDRLIPDRLRMMVDVLSIIALLSMAGTVLFMASAVLQPIHGMTIRTR